MINENKIETGDIGFVLKRKKPSLMLIFQIFVEIFMRVYDLFRGQKLSGKKIVHVCLFVRKYDNSLWVREMNFKQSVYQPYNVLYPDSEKDRLIIKRYEHELTPIEKVQIAISVSLHQFKYSKFEILLQIIHAILNLRIRFFSHKKTCVSDIVFHYNNAIENFFPKEILNPEDLFDDQRFTLVS